MTGNVSELRDTKKDSFFQKSTPLRESIHQRNSPREIALRANFASQNISRGKNNKTQSLPRSEANLLLLGLQSAGKRNADSAIAVVRPPSAAAHAPRAEMAEIHEVAVAGARI